jgi:hypothetical protein
VKNHLLNQVHISTIVDPNAEEDSEGVLDNLEIGDYVEEDEDEGAEASAEEISTEEDVFVKSLRAESDMQVVPAPLAKCPWGRVAMPKR